MSLTNKIRSSKGIKTTLAGILITGTAYLTLDTTLANTAYAQGCSNKKVQAEEQLKEPTRSVYIIAEETADLYKKKGFPLDVNEGESAKDYITLFEEKLDFLRKHNLSDLERSIKNDLSSAYDELGLSYKNYEKDLDKAKVMYEQSLELNPNNTKTLTNLGFFYYKHEKDYTKALDCFNKGLELEPNNMVFKIYKTKCLKSLNQ